MVERLAPCSSCVRETTHRILHVVTQQQEDRNEAYTMLQCAGCHTISMGRHVRFIPNGEVENTYYPSPVSRKKPTWVLYLSIGLVGSGASDEASGGLLDEIYQAVDGGQHHLAALGIRALLEHVMVAKIGDLPTFKDKLNAFQAQGYISLLQRDAIQELLEVGHAAMHRGFKPTQKELMTALDIVEGVLAPIFDHAEAATMISRRVPPRQRKPQ